MKKTVALCVVALSMMDPAQAGLTKAKIDLILITEGSVGPGIVYVYPVGGVTNPPPCHGANGDYYSFKMDRTLAKEYLSLLIAAHMSGAEVTFWGKGDCLDQSMSETINYIAVKQP